MYGNAASANTQEIQHELELVDRLRNRGYDMQRTTEGLVEMREQPREEAVRYRLAEAAAAIATRGAQERVGTSAHHLRQQRRGAQHELALRVPRVCVSARSNYRWRSMGV